MYAGLEKSSSKSKISSAYCSKWAKESNAAIHPVRWKSYADTAWFVSIFPSTGNLEKNHINKNKNKNINLSVSLYKNQITY